MVKLIKQKKELLIVILFSFFISFISFGSSPIVYNNSCDTNVFIIMGRALASGKVVYKDLFDHKGWYLYLFYALGSIISNNSELGIFFIESLLFVLESVFIQKIANLFLNKENSLIATFYMIFLGVFKHIGLYRGTTEGFAILFSYISIYYLLKYCKSRDSLNYMHPPLYMMIHGICVGIAFGIKANYILMWIPIPIFVIYDLLRHKSFILLIKNIIFGFFGVLISWCPMLLYAFLTNSIRDMYFGSIGFNMLYSSDNNGKLYILKNIINSNAILTILILFLFSLISIIISQQLNTDSKICILFMAILVLFGCLIGGRVYSHYFLCIVPFCIFFVVELLGKRTINIIIHSIKPITIIFGMVISYLLINNSLIKNIIEFHTIDNSSDLIKSIQVSVDNIETASVLSTGNNADIYVKLGVLPKEKYFYVPSISYELFPDAIDSQVSSIINSSIDILVINGNNSHSIYEIDEIDSLLWSAISSSYHIIYNDENTLVYQKN